MIFRSGILLLLIFFMVPVSALASEAGGKILKDTIWSGNINVTDDVLVIEGVTLTITEGTEITVVSAESGKTDPEYISPLTEITVRGSLIVNGKEKHPVLINSENSKDRWAGILIDGGKANISYLSIKDAEEAIYCIACNAEVRNSSMVSNTHGLVIQGKDSQVKLDSLQIKDNKYGLVSFDNPVISQKKVKITNSEVIDSYGYSDHIIQKEIRTPPVLRKVPQTVTEGGLVMENEMSLLTDTIWSGKVVIKNVVRVPQGVKLIIMPGTIVEFTFRDTNRDGIGENGILLQGTIWAKGTPERPILFTSQTRKKGAWDSISLIGSDRVQNIFENCIVEYAYRGVHSHFSVINLQQNIFRNNLRALQFQDSRMDIRDNVIENNNSGLQFRDSVVRLQDNYIERNYTGLSFLMSELIFSNNYVANNIIEGIRIRESKIDIYKNKIVSNRKGVLLFDSGGIFSRNFIGNSYENGFYSKNSNAKIENNNFANNRLSGLIIVEMTGDLRDNKISGNGHNGVSVSRLKGKITENTISHNKGNGISLKNIEGVIADNKFLNNEQNGLAAEKMTGDLMNNNISGNGRNGVSLVSIKGKISGNVVSDNKGNGISLKAMDGKITGNSIFGNKEYSLGIKSKSDIDARYNWWGSTSEKEIKKGIFDYYNDPLLGKVSYKPYLERSL